MNRHITIRLYGPDGRQSRTMIMERDDMQLALKKNHDLAWKQDPGKISPVVRKGGFHCRPKVASEPSPEPS